nr:zinc finger, CCHC-type [Tanacetum cinerariifolium]
MIFNIDSAMKRSYSNDYTCFSIDVIDEILEEYFDVLLCEGSKILHSIEGTLLEEEIFAEFDDFMEMTAENFFDFESDIEEPPFKKIIINRNYKIKTSLEEPPMDLELRPLPDNLKYVFLEEPSFPPVIISSQLSKEKKNKLISVLKKHKQAFAWKTIDVPAFMSTSKLTDSIPWHARLGHVHFKRMQDMSKDGDAIFNKNRFSSVPRPSLMIPNRAEDISGLVVPEKVTEEVVTQQPTPEIRKGKMNRTPNNFRPKFQLYLIEGTRDKDVTWKEAINDEMDSIMGNNTWVLVDLPLGYKLLGCKWIFKRKLKVNGTVEKFKARLVIRGFRQRLRIDYFDTYALVPCIGTIRLLIAMTSIHNLIIHQMDVKTIFLNGELDEEIYMNQHQGFIMFGNENKVDLTKKLLSSKFSMEDMGKADVVFGIKIKHESNRITISQSHYIEKVLKKFN